MISREIQQANLALLGAENPNIPMAMRLAAWSYQPLNPLPSGLRGRVYRLENKRTDADVILVATSERLWVIGVGTTSLRDVRRDLRAFRLPIYETVENGETDRPVRVHWGFWESAMSIAYQVSKTIEEWRLGDLPRVYCGHSLGGAVALILAKRFIEKTDQPCELITLGAPPVGGGKYDARTLIMEKSKKLNYHRIVNRGDGVVDITERDEGGTLLFSDRNHAIHKNPSWAFYSRERFAIRWRDIAKGRLSRIRDHSVREYLALAGLN